MCESFYKEKPIPREYNELYPCPCQKCKAKREADREAKREAALREKATRNMLGIKEEEEEAEGKVENRKLLSPQEIFTMYLEEAVSVIAFGTITVSLVWTFVARYAYESAIKVYHSNRNVQVAVVLSFSLILISMGISYHNVLRKTKPAVVKPSNQTVKVESAQNKTTATKVLSSEKDKTVKVVKATNMVEQKPSIFQRLLFMKCVNDTEKLSAKKVITSGKNTTVKAVDATNLREQKPSFFQRLLFWRRVKDSEKPNAEKVATSGKNKTATNLEEQKPSLFHRLFSRSHEQPVDKKNITAATTDTDEAAKEIFRQSKLFAIPTEMRQPPALLVYLRDIMMNND